MTSHTEQDLANAQERILRQFETISEPSQNGSDEQADLFCKACLDHEVEQVRRARTQFGQGVNASVAVLRTIAATRLQPVHMPIANLIQHLIACSNVAVEIKRTSRHVRRRLRPVETKRHHNRYDYGSLYEMTQNAQSSVNDAELAAEGASPAAAYSVQQTALYKLAKRKHESRSCAAARRTRPGRQNDKKNVDKLASDSETSSSDADTALPDNQLRGTSRTPAVGSSAVEQPALVADDYISMPDDFPASDLLKGLLAHAGELYGKRGLLSTYHQPEDAEGRKLPSMLQALDGSALICLGVLTECLVDAELNVPQDGAHLHPASAYFVRQIDIPTQTAGKKHDHIIGLAETILDNMPEGCEIGYKQLMTWPKHLKLEDLKDRRSVA